jgi:serine/threonine protein kinase
MNSGQQFEGWRRIGRGAFSEVFTARMTRGGRGTVAIKTDISGTDILKHEATVLHYLRRAGCENNIPHVIWFGLAVCSDGDDGDGGASPRHCLAMPYYERTLADFVAGDAGRAARAARAMVAVIAAVHRCGIIHRDIKPDNFRVDADGAPVLLDFGLADTVREAPQCTDCTEFTGTPAYASVFIHSGISAGRRDDLVAAGFAWIWMVEGRLPWDDCIAGLHGADARRIGHPAHIEAREMKRASALVLRPDACDAQRAYFAKVHALEYGDEPDYRALFEARP